MKDVQILLLITLVIDIAIGVVVFTTNRKRIVNQCYLELAFLIALWQISCLKIVGATTASEGMLFIRTAYFFTAFIPPACEHLRLAITFPTDSFSRILWRSRYFLVISFGAGLLSLTTFFLKAVQMPLPKDQATQLIEPVHGLGLAVYTLYLIIAGILILFNLKRDIQKFKGVQREELYFIVLGAAFALIAGSSLSLITPIFIGSFKYIPFSNALSILFLTSIIAYGIATRKILGITTILRRITAYLLLASYLIFIYFAIFHALDSILSLVGTATSTIAHVTATLVVAFTMAPMNGKLQQVANKLISSRAMDIPTTMKRADDIFQSITTINALFNHYSGLLKTALGAETVKILSEKAGLFSEYHPARSSEPDILVKHSDPIAQRINETKNPLCLDSLARARPTARNNAVTDQLEQLAANLAIGIFSKKGLSGIVLFGSRKGGRIYDKAEQDALQILCNQFSVALENAQMYTEMQDSKIRNEIMLDQLVSGVIVADPERRIALINNEAQRITGLTEEEALGQGLGLLPESISKALETTLTTKSGLQDTNAVLFAQEEKSSYVRMGSAYLLSHEGKPMGALLVFTDTTEVKGLEEQVRRADQLSSVGTLAAGMAHEIKNPLVTIKTFTQLLPKRYDDADFRKEFSSLVAHEVERIDGIVNQLLSFSKPPQPHLVPIKLHDTVEKTLRLIHEQLSQKNIALNNNLRAKHDLISGDADLLTQTLVNFNLNAIEAIEGGGVINVTTSNRTYRFAQGDNPDNAIAKSCIRLQISDTGKGIARDQLQKIFDPFFTSKSEGTGMGLSVAHGIIKEHHGAIEVESRQGKGTTFNIYIPILKEDVAV